MDLIGAKDDGGHRCW